MEPTYPCTDWKWDVGNAVGVNLDSIPADDDIAALFREDENSEDGMALALTHSEDQKAAAQQFSMDAEDKNHDSEALNGP